MRPYDVKSEDDLIRMQSDNHGDRDRWSIMNGVDHVGLHPPVDDSGKAWWIEIPRDQFNAIVDWYMRDQPTAEAEVGRLRERLHKIAPLKRIDGIEAVDFAAVLQDIARGQP